MLEVIISHTLFHFDFYLLLSCSVRSIPVKIPKQMELDPASLAHKGSYAVYFIKTVGL